MTYLLSTLTLIIPVWTGYQLTRTIGEPLSVKEKIPIGAVIGYTLSAWLIFLTSLMLKLGHASIWTTQAILIAVGVWCRFKIPDQTAATKPVRNPSILQSCKMEGSPRTGSPAGREGNPSILNNTPAVLFALFILLLVTRLAFRIIFEKPDGIYVGYDIPDIFLHLSHITNFVYGENLPPENPIFAGSPLRYPFLVNLFCAAIVKSGMPLTFAMNIQSWILISATLAVYSIYAYHISDRNRTATYVALLLLMFNGGMGFMAELTPSLSRLLEITGLHTSFLDNAGANNVMYYPWPNFFVELIVPGRTYLFGLPLVIVILCFLWWGIRNGEKKEFIWAGLLTALLPPFYPHGYFSIVLFSFYLLILFRTQRWLYFYIPATVIGLPQLLFWLVTPEATGSSIRLQLGWMAHGENMVLFWLRNLGVFLPLYLLGFVKASIARKNQSFIRGGLILFVVANIFLFAPWEWDNTKILIVWYMISVPLVSALLAKEIDGANRGRVRLGIALMMLAILSGLFKVIRISFTQPFERRIYTREETALAETIRTISPPRSVFLAAPLKWHVLYLAGRRSFLGDPEWTWTHGVDTSSRESRVERFYTTEEPNTLKLMKDAGIDYIIFGPEERKMFRREDFILKDYFTKIHTTENYQIYRLKGRVNEK